MPESDILTAIFERTLSLDKKLDAQKEDTLNTQAMSLWKYMADRLNEIAANTHAISQKIGTVASTAKATRARKKEAKTQERPREGLARAVPAPMENVGQRAPNSGDAQETRPERSERVERTQPSALPIVRPVISVAQPEVYVDVQVPAAAQAAPVSPSASAQAAEVQREPQPNRNQERSAVRERRQENSATAERDRSPERRIPSEESGSRSEPSSRAVLQQANERAEAQRSEEQSAERIGGTLRAVVDDNLGKLKDYLLKNVVPDKGDTKKMLGYGLLGPVYGAWEELFGKDSAAQGRSQNAENSDGHGPLRDRFGRFVSRSGGGGQVGAPPAQLDSLASFFSQQPAVAGSSTTRTNISARADASLRREEERQTEIAEAELRLGESEARAEDKRHRELIRALRGLGQSDQGSSGLFGDTELPDFDRGRGSRSGRAAGRRGVARAAGRRGVLGAVSGIAGSAGGMASGALSLGSRAAGLGVRAVPVIGQIAALGMAAYDGVEGWNDQNLHKQAFGLAEGQEATTGQKASSALAGILDMGGLTTGALNLFGIDVSKADMARGIQSFGSGVYDVAEAINPLNAAKRILGFGEDEKPEKKEESEKKVPQGKPSESAKLAEPAKAEVVSALPAQVMQPRQTAVQPEQGVQSKQPERVITEERTASLLPDVPQKFDTPQQSQQASQAALIEQLIGQTMEKNEPGTRERFFTNATADVFAPTIAEQKTPIPTVLVKDETTPTLSAQAPRMAADPFAQERRVREEAQKEGSDVASEQKEKSSFLSFGNGFLSGVTRLFSGSKNDQKAVPAMPAQPTATALQRDVAARDVNIARREGERSQDELKTSIDALTSTIQEQNKILTDWLHQSVEGGVVGGSAARSGGGGGLPGGIPSTPGAPLGGVQGSPAVGVPGENPGSFPVSPGMPGIPSSPQAMPIGTPSTGKKIGDTIAAKESGSEGVMAIGYDRTGGTSYGKWQLSSKTGSYEEWLQLLEKRGGESAAIAQRLRASGATNTGSKKGAHVDAYLREAAAHKELFEETQRESLLKNNYNPALKRIKSQELQGMIGNDAALQEMLFSTAVQHGGGGAAKIFNTVYKQGMSREDLIRAVYAERGGKFESSTAQVQASVRNRFRDEQNIILGMSKELPQAQPVQPMQPVSAMPQQGGSPGSLQPQQGIAPGSGQPQTAPTTGRGTSGFAARSGLRLKENGSIDLSTVKGLGSIRTEGNVDLQDMDPETAARMAAFASVHEQITGEKLTVTEGFRSFEEQQRVRNKLGAGLSATPGKSNHGTGIAFDIKPGGVRAGGPAVKRLEQIYKQKGYDFDQVLQEHGLARPLLHAKHAENWHIEALDRKTQEMARDRANLQSGKRKGSAYLSEAERQLYTGGQQQAQIVQQQQPTPMLPQAQIVPQLQPTPMRTQTPLQQQVVVQQAPVQQRQQTRLTTVMPQAMPTQAVPLLQQPLAMPQPVHLQQPMPLVQPVTMQGGAAPTANYVPGGTQKAKADLSRWHDRGSRNVNPGNVKGVGYLGQTGRDDKGHAIFATKEAGVAGIVDRLYRYNQQKRPGDSLSGKRTIRQIMDIYAPASDGNNTSAYAADISRTLGIGVDQEIDFKRNPELLKPFVQAIMKNESPGRKAYSDQEIDKGIEIGVDSARFGKEAAKRKHAAYLNAEGGQQQAQIVQQRQPTPIQPQAPLQQQVVVQQPPVRQAPVQQAPVQQSLLQQVMRGILQQPPVQVSPTAPMQQATFMQGVQQQPVTATARSTPAPQMRLAANSLLAAQSASLATATQEAVNRGVRYKMGAKNSRSGQIDCSGWVQEASNRFMDSVNASGEQIFSADAKKAFNRGAAQEGAAGIIRAVSQYSGQGPLTNEMLSPDKAREGMVIGVAKAGDSRVAGRYKGIGHIVQTFRDPKTGQLMVSESSSGDITGKHRNGVQATPYEQWYAWNQRKGRKLYGADLMAMADKNKAGNISPEAIPTAYPQEQASGQMGVMQGGVGAFPEAQSPIAMPTQSGQAGTPAYQQPTSESNMLLTGGGFNPQVPQQIGGQQPTQGGTVVDAILNAIGLPPQVATLLQQPASLLTTVQQAFQQPAQGGTQGLLGGFGMLVPQLAQPLFASLGGGLSQLLQPVTEKISGSLSQVIQPVTEKISNSLTQVIQPVSDAVSGGISQIVQPVASLSSNFVSKIGGGLSQIAQPIASLGTGISQVFQGGMGGVNPENFLIAEASQAQSSEQQSPVGALGGIFGSSLGQATPVANTLPQTMQPISLNSLQPGMQHSIAAEPRQSEMPEHIRDINPERGVTQTGGGIDMRALLAALEGIREAVVDGTRKAGTRNDANRSADGAPSIDVGFDDLGARAIAEDLV